MSIQYSISNRLSIIWTIQTGRDDLLDVSSAVSGVHCDNSTVIHENNSWSSHHHLEGAITYTVRYQFSYWIIHNSLSNDVLMRLFLHWDDFIVEKNDLVEEVSRLHNLAQIKIPSRWNRGKNYGWISLLEFCQQLWQTKDGEGTDTAESY